MNRLSQLHELTLSQTLAGLESGDFSSQELCSAYLQRIQALDPELKTFLHIAEESAQQEAKAADKRRAAARKAKEKVPALLGLPIAIKDVLTVAGMPATAGSRIL